MNSKQKVIKSMNNNQQTCVYSVSVRAHIVQATSMVRFPCYFSVSWKTNDQKVIIESGRFSAVQGKADFNQNLVMKTEVGYDKASKQFLKRETQLQLNLISKSKTDQPKLVGRTTIDLANLLNVHQYKELTELPLQFCSVNASLLASFEIVSKLESDLPITEMERSIGQLSNSSAGKANLPSIRERGKQISSIQQSPSGSYNESPSGLHFLKQFINSSPVGGTQLKFTSKDVSSNASPITIKEIKQTISEQDNGTRLPSKSFKQATSPKESVFSSKLSEIIVEDKSSPISKNDSTAGILRRAGSIQSSQSNEVEIKLLEELDRKKIEHDQIKAELDRYRFESQKSRQENDMLKLQLKQKQGQFEQTAAELSISKKQLAAVRQDLAKKMNESVQFALNVAQLKETNNKLSTQLASVEREVRRVQGINEQLRQAEGVKGQLNSQLTHYHHQLQQLQHKYETLSKEKSDLEESLFRLDEDIQLKSTKFAEKEGELIEQKRALTEQMAHVEQQLIDENHIRNQLEAAINEYENHFQGMENEIKTLNQTITELAAAQETWNKQRSEFEARDKDNAKRINDIEQSMIILHDKINELSSQNENLAAQSQREKSHYEKEQQQKDEEISKLQTDLLAAVEQLEEIKLKYATLTSERDTISSNYVQLQTKFDITSERATSQEEEIIRLSSACEELTLKEHELEQLLITTNEHKNKELGEADLAQRQLKLKIAQLEGQIDRSSTLIYGNEEKIINLEEELRGRENLIERLQSGLNTQVERNEELNNRLIGCFQRDEKSKSIITELQIEHSRVLQLLNEQQQRDKLLENELIVKDKKIYSLLTQLQFKSKEHGSLQQTLNIRVQEYEETIYNLKITIKGKDEECNGLQGEIDKRQVHINQLNQQITQFEANLHQAEAGSEAQQKELKDQIDLLQRVNAELEERIASRQLENEQLHSNLSTQQSQILVLQMKQESQNLHISQIQKQLAKTGENAQQQLLELEERNANLQEQYAQLQNELCEKEAAFQEEIERITKEYEQIKKLYDSLVNDRSSFDFNRHKQQLRDKEREISRLEEEVKKLDGQVSKVQNLQRTLKIKTIQLNSFKFKGKFDGIDESDNNNELLRLKDEEIAALNRERNRLLSYEYQINELRERVDALHIEMELLEEQKFNIQSIANEKALALDEARDQNRKMTEEIEIIGERNNVLERTLQDLLTKEHAESQFASEAALKAQIVLLKNQLREVEGLRKKITDVEEHRQKIEMKLQESEEKHMLDLIDQQIRFSKTESNPSFTEIKRSLQFSNESSFKQLPNMSYTCKALKDILQNRSKAKVDVKLIESLEASLAKQPILPETLQQKIRLLSKQLQKMKVQLLKGTSAGQQRLKLMNTFKTCEVVMTESIALVESLSY